MSKSVIAEGVRRGMTGTSASWQVFRANYVDSKLVKRFTGLDPAEKEQAHSWQKEIRGVFKLASLPKEGLFISVSSAVPLLTRVF
jgi:hypothetical protein